jgi:hypothetical protein
MTITTREQYMASSGDLHHVYYLEIAKACGVAFTDPKDIARFRKALETDEHMNNIPLDWWDARAAGLMMYNGRKVREVLKERGDFYSMAGGVCLLKAAACDAVANEQVAS